MLYHRCLPLLAIQSDGRVVIMRRGQPRHTAREKKENPPLWSHLPLFLVSNWLWGFLGFSGSKSRIPAYFFGRWVCDEWSDFRESLSSTRVVCSMQPTAKNTWFRPSYYGVVYVPSLSGWRSVDIRMTGRQDGPCLVLFCFLFLFALPCFKVHKSAHTIIFTHRRLFVT